MFSEVLVLLVLGRKFFAYVATVRRIHVSDILHTGEM